MKIMRMTVLLCIMLVLTCCKSRRDVVETASRDMWQEINLEMRRIDSVSVENEIYRRVEIDYYFPPLDSAQDVSRATEAESDRRGAVKRVVVETGQKSLLSRCVADTTSVSEVKAESDFKSVEANSVKKNNLPLAIAIASLAAAVCSLLLYSRKK